MVAGLGSSSFIMRHEHLASLSNKGINSKSGNSMVQFLTLCLHFSPPQWPKFHRSSTLLGSSHTEASQSLSHQEQASQHPGSLRLVYCKAQFEFIICLPGSLWKAQYIDFRWELCTRMKVREPKMMLSSNRWKSSQILG